MNYKIAFTGTSGSGKTTLAQWIEEEFNIPFISSSSGDIKTIEDEETLQNLFGVEGGKGHAHVIKHSIFNPEYALTNQKIILTRRAQLIEFHNHFVTDRSPLDNITYFINQCGFHKEITDEIIEDFVKDAMEAFRMLTHVIYIKPAQPEHVEDNGSRVPNKFYQKSVDAQFYYWLCNLIMPNYKGYILIIDWWDLNQRKNAIKKFLEYKPMGLL